jgi:hypothetical protein
MLENCAIETPRPFTNWAGLQESDPFWQWLRAINSASTVADLLTVRARLHADCDGPDRHHLLRLCQLQARRIEQGAPGTPSISFRAPDEPPTREWTLTDLNVVLGAGGESDETFAGEVGRSPTAVRVLRLAMHQFHMFGSTPDAEARLPAIVRAHLQAKPGAPACPWCKATF